MIVGGTRSMSDDSAPTRQLILLECFNDVALCTSGFWLMISLYHRNIYELHHDRPTYFNTNYCMISKLLHDFFFRSDAYVTVQTSCCCENKTLEVG
jgi:hypothetical protein